MPYLILAESESRERIIPIKDDRLMIGRHVDNDVVLNDKAVSGRHALIGRSGDDIVLEDLNSTNGVQVNGKAVMRHVLTADDRVVIGRNAFVFHPGEAPGAAADTAKPLSLPALETRPQTRLEPLAMAAPPPLASAAPAPAPALSLMDAPPSASAPTPSAPPSSSVEAPSAAALTLTLMDDAPPAPRPARLEVLSGAAAGRRMELNKPLTTLGKAGVQVVALRREQDDRYLLVAVEGPLPSLNEAPLPTPAPVLQSGDLITLGTISMRFVQD